MLTVEMTAVALIGAHLFFDYAGQGDFMSKAKNEALPIPGVPWHTIIASHAAIHGAAVALLTGVWWLFIAETALHYATDRAKCRGLIGFNTDQIAHIAAKAGYIVLIAAMPALRAW